MLKATLEVKVDLGDGVEVVLTHKEAKELFVFLQGVFSPFVTTGATLLPPYYDTESDEKMEKMKLYAKMEKAATKEPPF